MVGNSRRRPDRNLRAPETLARRRAAPNVILISRNGNILSRFEALGEQMAAVLDVDEAIIGGEVIAIDETGRPQFYDLMRRTRTPAYVAFDILWLETPRLSC